MKMDESMKYFLFFLETLFGAETIAICVVGLLKKCVGLNSLVVGNGENWGRSSILKRIFFKWFSQPPTIFLNIETGFPEPQPLRIWPSTPSGALRYEVLLCGCSEVTQRFTANRKTTSRNTIQDGEGGTGQNNLTDSTRFVCFWNGSLSRYHMGVWVGVHHGWFRGECSYQSYLFMGASIMGVPCSLHLLGVYIYHIAQPFVKQVKQEAAHTCACCMTILFRLCGYTDVVDQFSQFWWMPRISL